MSQSEVSAEAVAAAEWIVKQMTPRYRRTSPTTEKDLSDAIARVIDARLVERGEVCLISKERETTAWLCSVTNAFGLGASNRLLPDFTLMRVRPQEVWASIGYHAPAVRIF